MANSTPNLVIPFGSQVSADPRKNPRWDEKEGKILTLEELNNKRLIQRFRKKPVEIDAVLFNRESADKVRDWVGENANIYQRYFMGKPDTLVLEIPTLEGTMEAIEGDWIIRGIAGEFYPCRPQIFEATYEKVEGFERDTV